MSNLLPAIIDSINIRVSIQKLEDDMAQPDLTRVERARIQLEIAEKEDLRNQKIEKLLGGDTYSPTQIGAFLRADHNLNLGAREVNNLLIEMGFQIRDENNSNCYYLTEMSKSCEIGVAQTVGQINFCRWNEVMVDIIAEYVNK